MNTPLLVRLAILIACLATARGQDIRAYHRTTGGFDYYDFAGMFVGHSSPNLRSSFDFFDASGHLLGWADATRNNRVEFFDATGNLYRIIEYSIEGQSTVTDTDGKVISLSGPVYMGDGYVNYDPKGNAASYWIYGDYVSLVAPKSPDGR